MATMDIAEKEVIEILIRHRSFITLLRPCEKLI